MDSDCPPLADHLLAPSGGLVYHLRALRHRHGLWAPFQRVVADWLAGWQPGRRELVIVGPSAGYALPAGFLRRFERVTALEPDPLARWLLAHRPDAGRLGFSRLNCLATPDGLARLAAAHPEAAILFSNVLGQLAAPAEDWRRLIARHLSGHAWASYHDVISTTAPPEARQRAGPHHRRPKPGNHPGPLLARRHHRADRPRNLPPRRRPATPLHRVADHPAALASGGVGRQLRRAASLRPIAGSGPDIHLTPTRRV